MEVTTSTRKEQPSLKITNIKSSSKVPVNEDFSLQKVRQFCQYILNYNVTTYPSYLIIKPAAPSKLRYTLFKRKPYLTNVHCNITGCKTFTEHASAISQLANIVNCAKSDILTTFDNVSGKINKVEIFLKQKNISRVDLEKIASILEKEDCLALKYNAEIYASLVISLKDKETFLFYSSGKLLIVGGFEAQSMIESTEWITNALINAIMKL